MKLGFSATPTVYVPEFGGNRDLPKEQQFSVSITSMELGDFLIVVDAMSGVDLVKGDPSALPATEIRAIVEAAMQLFPKYCTVSGLQMADGTDVTIDHVVKDYRFLELIVETFTALMEISDLSEEDEKN